MTGERIEDMREVVLPFVRKRLTETNYENLGESDAKEFERDFNEILNLAIKALEREPVIDKIRAEIWDYIGGSGSEYTDGYNDGLYYAIDVIDKYKQEG